MPNCIHSVSFFLSSPLGQLDRLSFTDYTIILAKFVNIKWIFSQKWIMAGLSSYLQLTQRTEKPERVSIWSWQIFSPFRTFLRDIWPVETLPLPSWSNTRLSLVPTSWAEEQSERTGGLWSVGWVAPRSLATTWTRAGHRNCNYRARPPPPATWRRAWPGLAIRQSASNHQQSPPSTTLSQPYRGSPARVSSYYREMAWSSLLCCTQSKEAGEGEHETSQKLYGLHSTLGIWSQLVDIENWNDCTINTIWGMSPSLICIYWGKVRSIERNLSSPLTAL